MSKVNNGDLPGCPVTGSDLTKREQIAAMAMQGFLSNSVMGDCDLHENHSVWIKDITKSSIEFADALLSKLEQAK